MKMYLKLIIISIGIISLMAVSFDGYLQTRIAEAVLLKMSDKNRMPSSQDLVENIRTFLPYDKKLGDYFNLLGISKNGVGYSGMNSGHVQYFTRRGEENKCFVDLAEEYFRLIKMYDENVGIYSKIGDKTILQGRPSIIDKIGQGNRNHVKPGYAWDLALRMSQGDKHLALSLIASCGHDDEYRMFSPRILCPDRTSTLYTPGALGADINIDQKIIDRIVSVQAPTLGGKAIPAKYYHVIAAAFTSCMAIKNGVPSWMVKRGQAYAVRTYRAKRLCDRFSELSSTPISNYLGQTPSQESKDFKKNLDEISLEAQKTQVKKYFADKKVNVETDVAGGKLRINGMSLEGAITDYNARYIFLQNYPQAVSCNPKNVSELFSLLSYKSKLENLTEKSCPPSWNKSRCVDAIDKIKSWIIDFEWSEAEQKMGVEFAAKNCPLIQDEQPMDHNACSAFKSWNQGATGAQTPNSGVRQ